MQLDLETANVTFGLARNQAKYFSTKFGKVNPSRTESGLNQRLSDNAG